MEQIQIERITKIKSFIDKYIIYVDLESLLEKTDVCKKNPEKPSTTKVSEHIPLGFFNVYNIFI